MPSLLELNTFHSESGNLTVFEKIMPGNIKRVFYIYGAGEIPRGGHRHKKTWNALICLHGKCRVYVHTGDEEANYWLEKPSSCLILEPRDWHTMEDFSEDAILLVLSNEYYDRSDYIDEPYDTRSLEESFRSLISK
ncbi:sugar 3,4-ketoisomerase [Arundinibacter roseus]|uniref:WxcM-like domain-containing protein n=1 Tax=Arundinibacter roseus TaxID=2070510 RepID=A0A4R4KIF6_9BACT|nr:FdtA/QdtA family cupin domain-containing protein [Arundinibacter roseus]TDB67970.1 WxcM-like domain-containing protein [Arundinibacter roseus]